jgi:hypothetical protein
MDTRTIVIRLRKRNDRWAAELADLPGRWVFGARREDAVRVAQLHALRWFHDRLSVGAETSVGALRFALVEGGAGDAARPATHAAGTAAHRPPEAWPAGPAPGDPPSCAPDAAQP